MDKQLYDSSYVDTSFLVANGTLYTASATAPSTHAMMHSSFTVQEHACDAFFP